MQLSKGFTLIELLVTLVILAITLTFAVPYYKQQVQKSQLAEARSALLQNAQYMERIYSQQGSYQSGTVAIASTSYYQMAFDSAAGAPTSSTYTILALSSASGTTATDAAIDQNGNISCFMLATASSSRATVSCP